ncbi:MAG: AtpZ/AtpI family protein [Pseudomonadota bacterium]
MTDGPDPERLDALEKRLSEVKEAHAPKPREESHVSQAQQGWRMVTELVAGLLLGFGIGYGLDLALGTLPWLMILFTGFGFAAGVRTMMRTAEEVQRKNAAPGAGKGREDGD